MPHSHSHKCKKVKKVKCNSCNCHKCCDEKNTYDYVIIGAGTAGSVLVNRLTASGEYTVCVLESGRDDARLKEKLPLESTAPIPQPDQPYVPGQFPRTFNWGSYTRGTGGDFLAGLQSRGFGSWWFYSKVDNENYPSSVYHRWSGWGGCSSHNATFWIRNPPYNWDSWGLD